MLFICVVLTCLTFISGVEVPSPTDICSKIQDGLDHINHDCKCIDTLQTTGVPGIELQCLTYHKLIDDRIGWKLKIEPCTVPMNMHFTLHGDKLIHDLDFPGLKANINHNFPIPGISVSLPGLGQIGFSVALNVGANPSQLIVKVGIDACAKVLGHGICASNIPLLDKLFGAHVGPGMNEFKGAFENWNIPPIPIPTGYCPSSKHLVQETTMLRSPRVSSAAICVRNSAWFAMNYHLHSDDLNSDSENAVAAALPYTVGHSKCILGEKISGANISQSFSYFPVVKASLGKTENVHADSPVLYNASLLEPAYYECKGTTLNYHCDLASPTAPKGLEIVGKIYDMTMGFTLELIGDMVGLTGCVKGIFNVLKSGMSPWEQQYQTIQKAVEAMKMAFRLQLQNLKDAAYYMFMVLSDVLNTFKTITACIKFPISLTKLIGTITACVATGGAACVAAKLNPFDLTVTIFDATFSIGKIIKSFVSSIRGNDFNSAGEALADFVAQIIHLATPF